MRIIIFLLFFPCLIIATTIKPASAAPSACQGMSQQELDAWGHAAESIGEDADEMKRSISAFANRLCANQTTGIDPKLITLLSMAGITKTNGNAPTTPHQSSAALTFESRLGPLRVNTLMATYASICGLRDDEYSKQFYIYEMATAERLSTRLHLSNADNREINAWEDRVLSLLNDSLDWDGSIDPEHCNRVATTLPNLDKAFFNAISGH